MSALTNARDELRERLSSAKLHTPGGQLSKSEYQAILRSVARSHGVTTGEIEKREAAQ